MRFDHGQYRIGRKLRDGIPVKEVSCDQDHLHVVFGRISGKPLEIVQQFIPPAPCKISVQMGMKF